MNLADLLIEGAGLLLLALILAVVFALAGERRRIVFGAAAGMALAALTLPFVAYIAALITHHQATDMDLMPPAYIVATAISSAGLTLLGVIGGVIAETRYRRRHPYGESPRPRPAGDEDLLDDPAVWLPWGERRAGQTKR